MAPARPPEHAAFRDLNIFEERLRETAASLQRRKHRYQLFLAQLLVVILLLLIEVLLPPDISILSIPYKAFLCWLLPEVYSNDSTVILHPYFTTGLLFVSATTLALFFASGTYSEKIAYANKYVPHTNRALRSFNMFFNTRQPPLRSKFLWNPLSFFFPRPNPLTKPSSSRSPSPSASPSSSSSTTTTPTTTPTPSTPTPRTTRSQSASRPIHSIPPSRNSRGELIFSRRISKDYQDGYDRYRTTFEKKREEALRQIREQKSLERWWWVYTLMNRFWGSPPPTLISSTTPNIQSYPTMSRTSSSSLSIRGRLGVGTGGSSRSGTPPRTTTAAVGDGSGSPPVRQPRSSGRRSSNRRRTSSSSTTRRERERERERERDGGGEDGDMRMMALERSLALGSSALVVPP